MRSDSNCTFDQLSAPKKSRWADVPGCRASPLEADLARIWDLFGPPPSTGLGEAAVGLSDDSGNRLL